MYLSFRYALRYALGVGALAAAFLSPVSVANAQNLSAQDKMFIDEAAKAGMAEVHAAQMGLDKGSHQAVKTFSQRLVNDHKKANQELTDLAKKKGVTVPADDPKATASLPIASKTGADFDREWGKMMVDDHQKAVALFEKEASSGSDLELKDWANKTLPTLRSHLSEARALPKS